MKWGAAILLLGIAACPLDGKELKLSTSAGEYSEDSTFTFNDDATSFTVVSTYTAGGDCSGTCTGTGKPL